MRGRGFGGWVSQSGSSATFCPAGGDCAEVSNVTGPVSVESCILRTDARLTSLLCQIDGSMAFLLCLRY